MNSTIRFAGAPVKDFPDRKILRTCLKETALKKGFQQLCLQYVFLSDDELLEMNRKFLGHDDYTDIITFDLSDSENEIEGEIYISRDRIRENALKFETGVRAEYARVIAHGLLHLCGLGDKTSSEKQEMRKAEDEFLMEFARHSGAV